MADRKGAVIELFNETVCDWTPPNASQSLKVMFAPYVSEVKATRICKQVLSQDEIARSVKFASDELASRFIQRRAFRRYCAFLSDDALENIQDIEFSETDKGRPFLAANPSCWFSFSSCNRGFIGAWSSTLAVGVDMEETSRRLEYEDMAQGYFSPQEAERVRAAETPELRRSIFFRLWCLKEAALKSIGEGLPFGMDAYCFGLGEQPTLISTPKAHGSPDDYRPYLIEEQGLVAAIVARKLG